MAAGDLMSALFAFLIYSGPIVPLAATLFIRKGPKERFRLNLKRTLLFSSIQILALTPFAYALATHQRDAVYALYIPFVTGVIMFPVALLYAGNEFTLHSGEPKRSNDA
jgi:hypothetical protein